MGLKPVRHNGPSLAVMESTAQRSDPDSNSWSLIMTAAPIPAALPVMSNSFAVADRALAAYARNSAADPRIGR